MAHLNSVSRPKSRSGGVMPWTSTVVPSSAISPRYALSRSRYGAFCPGSTKLCHQMRTLRPPERRRLGAIIACRMSREYSTSLHLEPDGASAGRRPLDSSDDRNHSLDEHRAEHDCAARARPPRRPVHRRHLFDDAVLHALLLELEAAASRAPEPLGEPPPATERTDAEHDPVHETRSSTATFAHAPWRYATMPYPVATPIRARATCRSTPTTPRSCRTISTRPCMPPAAPAWPAESWPPEVFTASARDAVRSSTRRARSPSTA